jgi:Domain of unknown function (DUF4357)
MNTLPGRRSATIHVFLADGQPDGLREVEKLGWTGHALVCPRSRFPEAKAQEEFARTGVYVLLGPSEEGDLPTVYIGEGDPTRPRLEQHYRERDFWTSLIVFTSKDKNLNKAHVQYLESGLVALARDAKRSVLDNGNAPQLPTLARSDAAAMDAFLEEMLLIYPLLGLTAFEAPSRTAPLSSGAAKGSPEAMLYLKRAGEVVGRGYVKAERFVVLAGSQAVKEEADSIASYLSNLRTGLKNRGVLAADGDHFTFAQDYTFNSPSQAAGAMLGRVANGLIEWKDDQGRTLKALQQAAIGG